MNGFVEEYKIVRLEKADLKVLRWVMLARSTDEHHLRLMGILVKDGVMVACNGFCIHMAKPHRLHGDPLPDGNWLVRSIQKDLVILEDNSNSGNFPDYKAVMNVGFRGCIYQSVGWKVLIDINPALFNNALHMPARGVRMTAGNGPIMFEAKQEAEGEYELTAVVMPMHLGGDMGGITLVPKISPAPEEAQPA